MNGRYIINLDEFLALDDERMNNDTLNEHGVYLPVLKVAIFNNGTYSLWANPAKVEGGWRWSFSFDYKIGGGSSLPHPKDALHTAKNEIINDALAFAERYKFPMDEVRQMVGAKRVAIQKTLF